MQETFHVTDLDQLRLLSDPLKLRLVQAFAEGPKTVREAADALGENLTRLYRHVDALHEAGLLEITREEQKRGAVERTFCAVARRFEVDRSLLGTGGEGDDTIRHLLRSGEEELMRALADASDGEEPIFLRLRIKASPARLDQLRNLLEQWLEAAQAADEEEEKAPTAEAGAMIAFYRVS